MVKKRQSKPPVNPRISCNCGSEGPVNNRFNFCVCTDLDKNGKKIVFDAIFVETKN